MTLIINCIFVIFSKIQFIRITPFRTDINTFLLLFQLLSPYKIFNCKCLRFITNLFTWTCASVSVCCECMIYLKGNIFRHVFNFKGVQCIFSYVYFQNPYCLFCILLCYVIMDNEKLYKNVHGDRVCRVHVSSFDIVHMNISLLSVAYLHYSYIA
jgi:hypothetical protein